MVQTIKNRMKVELLQPWSTFVMKTQLPVMVLEKMIKITDEIIENKESAESFGPKLASQIEDEFVIDLKILEQEDLMMFFLDMCRTYIVQAYCQRFPFKKEEWLKEEWFIELQSMWTIFQKDNEYNPLHFHSNCDLSAVIYLKIPEYLPSRKSHNPNDDGAIIFTSNHSADKLWGAPYMIIQPKVGDFFIFPASQGHYVNPFRTPDGKGERRSISFNATFTSKSENEAIIKKQQEEIQLQSKKNNLWSIPLTYR